jgi:hypothetical protein
MLHPTPHKIHTTRRGPPDVLVTAPAAARLDSYKNAKLE